MSVESMSNESKMVAYVRAMDGCNDATLSYIRPYFNVPACDALVNHAMEVGITNVDALKIHLIASQLFIKEDIVHLLASKKDNTVLVIWGDQEFIIVDACIDRDRGHEAFKKEIKDLIIDCFSDEGGATSSKDISNNSLVSYLAKVDSRGFAFGDKRPTIIDGENGGIIRYGHITKHPTDSLPVSSRNEDLLKDLTQRFNEGDFEDEKALILDYVEAIGWRGNVRSMYERILEVPEMLDRARLLVSKGYSSNILFRIFINFAVSRRLSDPESLPREHTLYNGFSCAYAIEGKNEYIVIDFAPKVKRLTGQEVGKTLWERIERFKKDGYSGFNDDTVIDDRLFDFLHDNDLPGGFFNDQQKPFVIIGA